MSALRVCLIGALCAGLWPGSQPAAAEVSQVYVYDQIGRLSAVLYDGQQIADYVYDANGNLLDRQLRVAPTPIPVDSPEVPFAGAISATEFQEFFVAVEAPGFVTGKLDLTGDRGGTCVLSLVVLRADGSIAVKRSNVSNQASFQASATEGVWTFQLHAAGGCDAQSFGLEVALVSVLPLRSQVSLWLVAGLGVLLAGLLVRRTRREA